MAFSKQVLWDAEYRVIAFCGGPGRQVLMRRLTGELVRKQKRVLVTSTKSQMLPLKGEVLLSNDLAVLVDNLRQEFQSKHIVYAGKALHEKLLTGFDLSELRYIKNNLSADYMFIDLCNSHGSAIVDSLCARHWARTQLWDQLIYFLDLSELNHPLDERLVENLPEFKTLFPSASRLSDKMLLSYLTDDKNGIRPIFEQEWPAILFLGDVDETAKENFAITFSRELNAMGVRNIVIGNPESSVIKKINFA